MVTLKQLADELGVSKQAVYNRVTKEPLKSMLESNSGAKVTSADGTIFLSDDGAQIVRSAYAEKYPHMRQPQIQQTPPPQMYGHAPAHGQNPYGHSHASGHVLGQQPQGHIAPYASHAPQMLEADGVMSQISSMNQTLTSLTTSLSEKDLKISELQDMLRTTEAQASTLSGAVNAKDTAYEALQRKYDDVLGQARVLQTQAQSLKTKLEKNDGGASKAELEEKESELKQLRKMFEASEASGRFLDT